MQRNRRGMGYVGYCICPKCGDKVLYQAGKPCREDNCRQCGGKMVREGSYHHQLIEEKKKALNYN